MTDIDLHPDLEEAGGRELSTTRSEQAPLFEDREAQELRSRWESAQASFVDKPRRSVEEADGLVKDVLERLEERFSREHERLEEEWSSGDQATTEDLRVALQHYRSFFERLLTI
jgi:hypothetical protein